MKQIRIPIRPDRLAAPLPPAVCGKLSSAVFAVHGDLPDDTDSISVLIGRTPDPETSATRPAFAVAADEADPSQYPGLRPDERVFRAYVSPFCFPEASNELEYHVMASDANGNPRWLGTGNLEVLDCPADGSPVAPDIIPADTYIRNPATGLYHKLTAAVNDLGEIALELDENGIMR